MLKPTSWYDISINQYLELVEEKPENGLEILSILLDVPLLELADMDVKDLTDYLNGLSFTSTNLPSDTKSFTISGNTFHKKGMTTLTVGEFIDLEYYFTNDYHQNLSRIVSVLWRREISNDIFNGQVLEPYGTWVDERSKLFGDQVGIGYVFGVISEYLSYRNKIFKAYEGLFDDVDTPPEDNEENENTPKQELTQSEKSINKWGWSLMVLKLSNGNGMEFEKSTDMNLLLAFNILSMKKELKID